MITESRKITDFTHIFFFSIFANYVSRKGSLTMEGLFKEKIRSFSGTTPESESLCTSAKQRRTIPSVMYHLKPSLRLIRSRKQKVVLENIPRIIKI